MMFNGLMLAKVHFSLDKSSLHKDFSASLPPCVVSLPAVCRKQAKAFPQTHPLFDTNIDTEVLGITRSVEYISTHPKRGYPTFRLITIYSSVLSICCLLCRQGYKSCLWRIHICGSCYISSDNIWLRGLCIYISFSIRLITFRP